MLENSLKHMYYRDTFLHQSQLWTKVLENNAKLKTWKKNVSSFLGLQMRSAICNTMDTLSSDLVRCNHSLIKGTNVPWRNTCFQEWDNKKNETWTSSNVTEWGSSREKKKLCWWTHVSDTQGSPKLTDERNDIRGADPKDEVKSVDLWIHVYIVSVWVFNAEGRQRANWMHGSLDPSQHCSGMRIQPGVMAEPNWVSWFISLSLCVVR